jgi:hypothetical protein
MEFELNICAKVSLNSGKVQRKQRTGDTVENEIKRIKGHEAI